MLPAAVLSHYTSIPFCSSSSTPYQESSPIRKATVESASQPCNSYTSRRPKTENNQTNPRRLHIYKATFNLSVLPNRPNSDAKLLACCSQPAVRTEQWSQAAPVPRKNRGRDGKLFEAQLLPAGGRATMTFGFVIYNLRKSAKERTGYC